MKKKIIILLSGVALLVLSGGLWLSNPGIVGANPFNRDLVFEYASYAVTDSEDNCYVIDQSQRRIIKMTADGSVDYIINGGDRNPGGFFYAYEVAVDENGSLYVLNGVLDDRGFFMMREEIVKYNPDGVFDKIIFSKSYGEDDRRQSLVQRGQLISLTVKKGNVSFYDIDGAGIYEYRLMTDKGNIDHHTVANMPDANLILSSVSRIGNDEFLYVSKSGSVVRQKTGNPPVVLYQAPLVQGWKSIPWWVSHDEDGRVYFSDLGSRSISLIESKNAVKEFLSQRTVEKGGFKSGSYIYYRFSIDDRGNLTTCNDNYVVRMKSDSSVSLHTDSARYGILTVFWRLVVWLSSIVSVVITLAMLFYFYWFVIKRRISLMVKLILIFIPLVIASIWFITSFVIKDFSERYQNEVMNKIAQMTQVLPHAVDTRSLGKIVSYNNFMDADYRKIRGDLLRTLNYNRDEWNNGLYFVLYRVIDDHLYGLMYLNGLVGVYYPMNSFDDPDSVYRRAYNGEICTMSESDAWGSWLYGVGPIRNAEGKIIALIEVGSDQFSFTQANERLRRGMIARIMGITLIFIVILVLASWFILLSIRVLRNGVLKLARGEWDTKVKVRNRYDEVADLTDGFNRMADYIRSYIHEITELNKGYYRFVPEQFLRYLDKENVTQVQLGDQVQKVMTVLFSDIRSFTTLSEKMSPKENFDFINTYLKSMGPVIREQRGFIDKYIGDAIMALFPHSADDGLAAALGMCDELVMFNKTRADNGLEPIGIGLGIHTGTLMLGVIGESERMDGTVISDNVNFASRLEGLTKHFGAQILISEDTYNSIDRKDRYMMRYLGKIQVKGKKTAAGVYEVIDALDPKTRSLKVKTRDVFEKGVRLYQEKRFEDALTRFSKIIAVHADDKATLVYVEICKALQQRDLSSMEWDGSIMMREK